MPQAGDSCCLVSFLTVAFQGIAGIAWCSGHFFYSTVPTPWGASDFVSRGIASMNLRTVS